MESGGNTTCIDVKKREKNPTLSTNVLFNVHSTHYYKL